MKVAVCAVAYNEAGFIRQHVQFFKRAGFHYLLLLSAKPWNGQETEYDGTGEIAEDAGAEVIKRYWHNETEQRDWGLARLYDYDYVLTIDPDEFMTREDLDNLLIFLENPVNPLGLPCPKHKAVRCAKMITYWKTPEYVFDPLDSQLPVIAVRPKEVGFFEFRVPRLSTEKGPHYEQPTSEVVLHHFSWVRSDRKVKEKIGAYGHANVIPQQWYEKVWKAWTPGSDMLVRPYGSEQSKAVYQPAPSEILHLLES